MFFRFHIIKKLIIIDIPQETRGFTMLCRHQAICSELIAWTAGWRTKRICFGSTPEEGPGHGASSQIKSDRPVAVQIELRVFLGKWSTYVYLNDGFPDLCQFLEGNSAFQNGLSKSRTTNRRKRPVSSCWHRSSRLGTKVRKCIQFMIILALD